MDNQLLDYYLALKSPEAGEWNSSPENLHAEWRTRDYIRKYVPLEVGFEACNIGIGTGDWDDFLGYWLKGRGRLTSIDINRDICELFAYRQRSEGHPNPSNVMNKSLFDPDLPQQAFDLVTMIGSTIDEAGQMKDGLDACFGLLKPEGRLMFMASLKSVSLDSLEQALSDFAYRIEQWERYEEMPQYPFFICMIRRDELTE
ncbi:class I SAM-dependent methyltransferase [Paenibacillus harenae]|uniref:Ubiquinone/menaquinone biosynthesis C-methylase UbiE n=1 Tax=Paenibacillus harenae TaxID=306543 RepID=A0ABT9TYX2_PAEHA|nr:class I SAM-dependent methyltransferase [Paenibacillus harenae]MDQ0059111.1 ubiquinone/menaquinone biosynthesis C-methylase UbiE [Paenibacillus harenae]MDQ0112577.1 ubiquinone/menaquinone biosynthesis C-methylase UbiE [Paenibacillus harenae]